MSTFQEKKQYLENAWYDEMKFKPETFNVKYYEALAEYFIKREQANVGWTNDDASYSYYDGIMAGMRIVRQYLIQTLIMEKEEE